jgi:hypothetical protein
MEQQRKSYLLFTLLLLSSLQHVSFAQVRQRDSLRNLLRSKGTMPVEFIWPTEIQTSEQVIPIQEWPTQPFTFSIAPLPSTKRWKIKTALGKSTTASRSITKPIRLDRVSIESKSSLDLFEQTKSRFGMADAYNLFAQAHFHLGNPKEALFAAHKGLSMAQEIGTKKVQSDYFQLLSDIHASQKNLPLAYSYSQQLIAIKDSINNEEKTTKRKKNWPWCAQRN